MNMDEFLPNIWTVEKNQVINEGEGNGEGLSNQNKPRPLRNQPSMPRQGSLTLPAPLCRKTVDEIWSEINQEQNMYHQPQQNLGDDGEMTQEDFMITAGVVRETCGSSSFSHRKPFLPSHQPAPQHYGLCRSTNSVVGPNFGMGPIGPFMNMGFSDHQHVDNVVASGISGYQTDPQIGGEAGESSSTFVENGKGEALCFNGHVVSNGGGYGPGQTLEIGPPVVSANGMGSNPVDNWGVEHVMNKGGPRGKKRIVDDSLLEKMVERRQKRMIENRESAARSRARKEAHTAELEAEFARLTEANARIRQATAELYKMMRKKELERLRAARKRVPETKAEKTAKKLKMLQRRKSFP